jgi:hypothetical protein
VCNQEKKREQNEAPFAVSVELFILGFTDRILDGQLNIIIFKFFIDDSVC